MKRLHVNIAVKDIAESVRFYSALFATEPTVQKEDYAKWELEDPRVNFSIGTCGRVAGLDHLGIQVESAAELGELRERLTRTEGPLLEEGEVTCCYARSDKSWIVDPQGVRWEAFHTLGPAPVYGTSRRPTVVPQGEAACCGPVSAGSAACCDR